MKEIFEGEYRNGYKKIGKEYFYEFINTFTAKFINKFFNDKFFYK